MKALSIKQPWAWLIVNGHKDIENRNWATKFRGEVMIHAGKAFDHDGHAWVYRNFPHIQLPRPSEFEKGGIVGKATITDCVTESESPWFMGEHGFVLSDAKPVDFMPCRGQLGFFTPNINHHQKEN